MSNPARYTRAFAKALADHLRGRVPAFTDYRTGSGGCDTCGHGASEYEVLDMDRLENEIEQFAAEFKDVEGEQA